MIIRQGTLRSVVNRFAEHLAGPEPNFLRPSDDGLLLDSPRSMTGLRNSAEVLDTWDEVLRIITRGKGMNYHNN